MIKINDDEYLNAQGLNTFCTNFKQWLDKKIFETKNYADGSVTEVKLSAEIKQKLNIPIATPTTPGLVKGGVKNSNQNQKVGIEPDGTMWYEVKEYVLPNAFTGVLGGVKAKPRLLNVHTREVGIDVDGRLWSESPTYTLPKATSTILGGVKAVNKPPTDNAEVSIDSNGKLWYKSGGKSVARFVIGTSSAGWTVNDCDYLCDGVADDVEINAAIQALPSTGGKIIILDGVYKITNRINVNKNYISIYGNGRNTKLERNWSESSSYGVIDVVGSNCNIENLFIEGKKSSYASGYGIKISSNYNLINNLYVSSAYSDAVYISGGYNTIKNSVAVGSKTGINVVSNNAIITNNVTNGNVDYGIYVGSNYISVFGNKCNSNKHGIFINAAKNNICSNICNDNKERGIWINDLHNLISNNTCINNSVVQIELTGSTYSGNTISNNICFRGSGRPEDYTTAQYTIKTAAKDSLICNNMILGKNYVNSGTNNTFANNKYN